MKKWLTILLVMGFAVSAYAQDRGKQILSRYQALAAREREQVAGLEATKQSIEQVKGMLQERQVADQEIAQIQKALDKLEKEIAESKEEEKP